MTFNIFYCIQIILHTNWFT